MVITKEQCNKYEAVRTSGVTNMWNVGLVSSLTGLSKDTLLEIMKNYTELNNQYHFRKDEPETTLSDKLTLAFRELRKLGYFARKNFWCCQTCAWSAIPDTKADRAVFYHQQDKECLDKRGYTYLAWSGDANEIIQVLKRHGINTEWDGSETTRIKVSGEGE